MDEVLLVGADHLGAHGLLEREHQAGPNRLDDGRGPGLLPVLGVVQVGVVVRAHVGDRSAADDVRHRVGQQLSPNGEHARGPRAADELVRAEHHRVLVGGRVLAAHRIHVDLHIRCGGREVPERQGAELMQQRGHGTCVRHDAGDVAGGRERADFERPIRVPLQCGAQRLLVDVAIGILRDGHHIGDRFAPRQFVAVVLERADEHHWAFVGRNLFEQVVARGEIGGQAQIQDPDESVDRAGGAGSGEDDRHIVAGSEVAPDDAPSIFAQHRRL